MEEEDSSMTSEEHEQDNQEKYDSAQDNI